MNKRVVAMAALVMGPLLMASAKADPLISIGLQEAGANGGAITTVASGTGSAGVVGLNYGTFTANTVSGMGNPPLPDPDILDSNAINVSSSGSGTLYIYISETNIAAPAPSGVLTFFSSFTENLLSGPITVAESTYLDAKDRTYALTTPLGGTSFPPLPAIQPVVDDAIVDTGAGPYSVTAVYQISAAGAGQDNATIDVSVPAPASLILFGTALLGLGWFGPHRKNV